MTLQELKAIGYVFEISRLGYTVKRFNGKVIAEKYIRQFQPGYVRYNSRTELAKWSEEARSLAGRDALGDYE